MIKDFKAFLMRGNVVDLAVAVVIGAAFGAVVNSFVQNIITPIVGAIFGGNDFGSMHINLTGDAVIAYGAFINSLITFVSVAAAIFFFVVKPLNALAARRQRGEEPEPVELNLQEELLTEIRDLLRAQQTQ